jgi:peptidyl-prolyl cis-trans isomerase D
MLRSIQQRDLEKNRWIKITMSVILLFICLAMVITLVPGLGGFSGSTNPDTVARVGSTQISALAVEQHLDMMSRTQSIPAVLRGLYAKQVLDQMIFQQALEVEAARLGMRVTADEEAQRIKEIFPSAFQGDTWLRDRYMSEVERTGMSVSEFEGELHDVMLSEKFRHLVTDGITVSPAEIEQEFHRRNDKVQIEYALIKPSDLASSIHPSDADLSAYFSKHQTEYQIPEKRSARYALLNLDSLRENTKIPDSDVLAYYDAHLNDYKVENRVHVEHILFKTIGKTDAEVAEIQRKAADVLAKAKHGANFEDLAKKYSEDDATKAKGGDLGWIVEGQTVPEFQKAAFSLPNGAVSDLVKTQYGFHIIKVLDHEQAHTKTLDEVRSQILPVLLDQKVSEQASDISNQLAEAVRQSNRQSVDDLAKRFHLAVADIPPVSAADPLLAFGNSPDVRAALFGLHTGELSMPIQVPQGFVILSPKEVLPAHQGTLAEAHDKVLADYQQTEAQVLAQEKASELSKQAQGQDFSKAAKALGLNPIDPEPFARTGTVPDVGSAKLLESAFSMPDQAVGRPLEVAGNWLVFRVVSHQPADPTDLAQQSAAIQAQLLQTKQNAAFEAFHNSLIDRLRKEGKIVINADAVERLTKSS